MPQKYFHPTAADMADAVFDGTQVAVIPAEPGAQEPVEWLAMERGSDEHIAFLEQIIGQLQSTLKELKEQREGHGR